MPGPPEPTELTKYIFHKACLWPIATVTGAKMGVLVPLNYGVSIAAPPSLEGAVTPRVSPCPWHRVFEE